MASILQSGLFGLLQLTKSGGGGDEGPVGPAGPPGPQGEPGADFNSEPLIFVRQLSDLPIPVNGVIEVPPSYSLFLVNEIDLAGNRLHFNSDSAVVGTSPDVSVLKSTGISTALPNQPMITTNHALYFENVGINLINQNNPAIDMDGLDITRSFSWKGSHFVDTPNIGRLANYNTVSFSNGKLTNSAGMVLDGSINVFVIDSYEILGREGLVTGTILASCTIQRRFTIRNSSIITPLNGLGLNVVSANSFPTPESAILDNIVFEGAGAPLTTTLAGTNKSVITRTRNVPSRSAGAYVYMLNNITSTPIPVQGQFVKIQGVTIPSELEKFLGGTNATITNNGASLAITESFVSLSAFSGGNNTVIAAQLFLSRGGAAFQPVAGSLGKARTAQAGTPVNLSLFARIFSVPGDIFAVYITNENGTQNLTVTELSWLTRRET